MIEMCAFQVGNLTYLSLEGNMIGDQGFQKLAEVIPGTEVSALLKTEVRRRWNRPAAGAVPDPALEPESQWYHTQ